MSDPILQRNWTGYRHPLRAESPRSVSKPSRAAIGDSTPVRTSRQQRIGEISADVGVVVTTLRKSTSGSKDILPASAIDIYFKDAAIES